METRLRTNNWRFAIGVFMRNRAGREIPEHPHGSVSIGFLHDTGAFELEDKKNFTTEMHYVGDSLIAVSGDLDFVQP